jgi:hypothetical protein
MPEIDVTVPLSDIYADVELTPPETGEIPPAALS